MAEKPERVGQAQPDDQLGVLPVAQHVRLPAGRLEAPHRRLEVVARLGEAPRPVGGDAPDVVAFHPQDLVVVPFGPRSQPLAEFAGRIPVPAGEGSEGERPDQRRLGVAAELAGEPQSARVHAFDPPGRVAFTGQQRRRQRREQP